MGQVGIKLRLLKYLNVVVLNFTLGAVATLPYRVSTATPLRGSAGGS